VKPNLGPIALAGSVLVTLFVASAAAQVPARISRDSIVSDQGIVLIDSDRLSTPGAFPPPVDITIVAKTDSNNLRLSYAADQVIFNWEMDNDQLRVDGGPGDGQHKSGAGRIPPGKYVTIRWVVTPKHQAIYVDKELRFKHDGDYSGINRCVSVFAGRGAKVTVKSIHVKQLVPALYHDAVGTNHSSTP
jgi:hypothetical protein